MNEKWLLIKEIDKPYYISNLGNIKNATGYVLKAGQDKYGYKRITLAYNNNNKVVRKTFFIHRLVAQYFLANENNYPHVTFKNQCREDIRVENLEWCRKAISKTRKCDNKGKPVICLDTGEVFKNISDASGKLNISIGSIYNCCNKNVKTAGGYKWQYYN